MTTLFKALNDPTRREIMELLKKEDLTAGEIAEQFKISKPSISHHLDLLKQADLVTSEKKGQYITYSLNATILEGLLAWIMSLKQEKDDLEREILLIELDRFLFYKADMELTAKDRMREISTWSKIKQELNDGSFDDENVNTHQTESYRLKLQEEAKHIQGLTHPSEISNVLGQLSTLDRIVREGQLLNQKKENKKLKK